MHDEKYLQCAQCEEVLHFPVNSCLYAVDVLPCRSRILEDRDSGFPRLAKVQTLGIWCGVCNRPSFAERIPNSREIANLLGLMKVRRAPDGIKAADWPEIEDLLASIDQTELEFLAQVWQGRRAPGPCLWCGGHSYRPIGTTYSGPTQLRHEGCGGVFLHHWKMWLGGAVWRADAFKDGDGREPRWYDLSGNFIAQSYDPFGMGSPQAL
jgi:hypothetical protein